MHFGKAWKEAIGVFPEHVQNLCIPYKTWKKWIAREPDRIKNHWQGILTKECHVVDKALFSSSRTSLFPACFRTSLSPTERFDLSVLNTTTLFKICKKLQKRLDVPAMEWYTHTMAAHRFRFTQSAQKTLLELSCRHALHIECPICLENFPVSFRKHERPTGIIMKCGHTYCLPCIERYWNMSTINSPSLYVRLAIASRNNICPMCRLMDAADGAILID